MKENIDLPQGETKEMTVTIKDELQGKEKEITVMETDGVKHSVPLSEIISGGVGKDGIPSIDNPKFVSVEDAGSWLSDNEPGLSFSRGGTDRFYPYKILVSHEIVNDKVGGERVLVTYCPLCLSGIVLDPLVKGERVEFGVSGKLWKANLVMYDRKTESLWSQVSRDAIVGEMTGTKLKLLPSDQILYGNWKKRFPQGEVLSRETGRGPFYTYERNPYGSYYSVVDFAVRIAGASDDRLPNDAFVFGIIENDKPKAYSVESVMKKGREGDETVFKAPAITPKSTISPAMTKNHFSEDISYLVLNY